jgi:alkylated DNA repair dioxygenase AlkB
MGPLHNLLPVDGEAYLYERWLLAGEATALLGRLVDELDWRQEHARFGAKVVALPRLTAWYGDVGYRYSGVDHPPRPWPRVLADLRDTLPRVLGSARPPVERPNTVLVNFYRDGSDSMGWHSDNEPVLGPSPTIWSVSLGATRKFVFRHRSSADRIALDLPGGSLLVMAGACQRCWEHSVPKTSLPVPERVNLTFRLTAPSV